jgi:hypothetical protein
MKTIFDDPQPWGPNFQRRLGFFYSHNINPAAVRAGSTEVEPIDKERVRVTYGAIVLGPGEADWSPLIPAGIDCVHGDGCRPTVRRTLNVPRHEVEVETTPEPCSTFVINASDSAQVAKAVAEMARSMPNMFSKGGAIR